MGVEGEERVWRVRRVGRGCGVGLEGEERVCSGCGGCGESVKWVWRVGRECEVGVEGRERVGVHGTVKLTKYLRHPQV